MDASTPLRPTRTLDRQRRSQTILPTPHFRDSIFQCGDIQVANFLTQTYIPDLPFRVDHHPAVPHENSIQIRRNFTDFSEKSPIRADLKNYRFNAIQHPKRCQEMTAPWVKAECPDGDLLPQSDTGER